MWNEWEKKTVYVVFFFLLLFPYFAPFFYFFFKKNITREKEETLIVNCVAHSTHVLSSLSKFRKNIDLWMLYRALAIVWCLKKKKKCEWKSWKNRIRVKCIVERKKLIRKEKIGMTFFLRWNLLSFVVRVLCWPSWKIRQ